MNLNFHQESYILLPTELWHQPLSANSNGHISVWIILPSSHRCVAVVTCVAAKKNQNSYLYGGNSYKDDQWTNQPLLWREKLSVTWQPWSDKPNIILEKTSVSLLTRHKDVMEKRRNCFLGFRQSPFLVVGQIRKLLNHTQDFLPENFIWLSQIIAIIVFIFWLQ